MVALAKMSEDALRWRRGEWSVLVDEDGVVEPFVVVEGGKAVSRLRRVWRGERGSPYGVWCVDDDILRVVELGWFVVDQDEYEPDFVRPNAQ